MNNPVREYKRIDVVDSGNPGYTNRILIGTAATGLVRIEWVQARHGQIIPVNWGQVDMVQGIPSVYPMRYQVADAQNVIVAKAIEKEFEWLLLWEHDVLPPVNSLVMLNKYMTEAKTPAVSGLYFTRSIPSEPLIFRGRGTGAFYDWEPGDLVYCDGLPTGFLLIHMGVIRAMWPDCEEYQLGQRTVRRIFIDPRDMWMNPETGEYNSTTGTSDLNWCTRVMEGDYMRKAGWGDYLDSLEDPRYPFLVDTRIWCSHINPDGTQFRGEQQ